MPSKLSTAAARQTPTLSMAEAHSAWIVWLKSWSRKSSQIHKVQFLNFFLVNFSIISYLFLFVSICFYLLILLIHFCRLRTLGRLSSWLVPGVQIRSLGNHRLSIDIFLVLLASNLQNTYKKKKKREKYWKYMPKCKELSGLGHEPIPEVSRSAIDNRPTSRIYFNNNVEKTN